MPNKTYQAEDYVEPLSDSVMEQFGNSKTYNVIDGCDITYSAADLTVTIAAGNITHDGSRIAVAGGSVTLVPNASNPLWAWVAANSSGTITVTHGTAAANPTIPESGDVVEIALIKVEANQTIANNCATKLDKRMHGLQVVSVGGGGATSATLSADFAGTSTLAAVTGLSVDLAASTSYAFKMLIHYTATAANDYYFSVQATNVVSGSGLYEYEYYNAGATGSQQVGIVTDSATGGQSAIVNGFGASTPGVIVIAGSFTTGPTAGTLQYRHKCDGGATQAKSRIELY